MPELRHINLAIAVTVILLVGITAGYSLGNFLGMRNRFPEIKFTGEINQGIATIELLEVKNGILYGRVKNKPARIAFSTTGILDIEQDAKFAVPVDKINLEKYYKTENIPGWAMYAASKSGKYYYSVLDKRVYSLSDRNIQYFRSSSEAEKLGFIKK